MKKRKNIYLFRSRITLLIILSVISLCFTPVTAAPSIYGSSGLIITPSPESIEKQRFEMAAHYETYNATDLNGYSSGESWTHIAGNYGITDSMEIGFEKTLDSNSLFTDPDICITGKYVFEPENLGTFTFGGLLNTTTNAYNSLYMLYGKPTAYIGFGSNFGGVANRQNNFARYGGYSLSDLRPDSFYVLAGLSFSLGRTKAMLEYDGDTVNAGLRYPVNEQFAVDVAYIGNHDVDEMYSMSGPWRNDYKRQNFSLGIAASF